jgi:hypothetical protein
VTAGGQSPQPASFGALFVRAMRLCVLHWRVFLMLVVAACALEALLYFTFHRTEAIVNVADALVTPVLAATVFAIAANDLSEEQLASGAIAARVGERAWAVIALSNIPVLLSPSLFHLDPDGSDSFGLVVLGLFVTLLLVFAPVYATLEPHVGTLQLLPRSVVRSVGLLFQGNFLRAAIIVILSQTAGYFIAGVVVLLQGAHVPDALFLAIAPLDTLLTVPLSGLLVAVYFDALLRGRLLTNSP